MHIMHSALHRRTSSTQRAQHALPRFHVSRGPPCLFCSSSWMRRQVRGAVQVCKFFLEHGKCKFGKNCKFNHPNIAFKEGPYAGSMVRAAGMLGQNFYSSAF